MAYRLVIVVFNKLLSENTIFFKASSFFNCDLCFCLQAQDKQELDIRKNEKLILLDDSKHWWKVVNRDGLSGFVPSNYVKRVKPSILSSLKNTLGRKRSAEKGIASSRNGDVQNDHLDVHTTPCVDVNATVVYNYQAKQSDELGLTKGETIAVLEKSTDGWWRGKKDITEETGWFPSNYVKEITDSDSRDNGCEIVEVCLTLYPFIQNNPEELSFESNERLEILEKPATDPDWWRARNARGEIGLVPRNYVQVVEADFENTLTNSHSAQSNNSGGLLSSDSSNRILPRRKNSLGLGAIVSVRHQFNIAGPLEEKPWYYGSITRAECDVMLDEIAENGDFLIRDSESKVCMYVTN